MPDDTKRYTSEDLAKALAPKQRQFADTYLTNGLPLKLGEGTTPSA